MNKPSANGEAIIVNVFDPPADSPKIVTLFLSPPNDEILIYPLKAFDNIQIAEVV